MHERERELMKQEVGFIPAGEFSQEGLVSALRLENGDLLMNTAYRHETRCSPATMKIYQNFLRAEHVIIKGRWVFVPDKEENEDDENVGS